MGKKAKEHRKKVEARNNRLKMQRASIMNKIRTQQELIRQEREKANIVNMPQHVVDAMSDTEETSEAVFVKKNITNSELDAEVVKTLNEELTKEAVKEVKRKSKKVAENG